MKDSLLKWCMHVFTFTSTSQGPTCSQPLSHFRVYCLVYTFTRNLKTRPVPTTMSVVANIMNVQPYGSFYHD